MVKTCNIVIIISIVLTVSTMSSIILLTTIGLIKNTGLLWFIGKYFKPVFVVYGVIFTGYAYNMRGLLPDIW